MATLNVAGLDLGKRRDFAAMAVLTVEGNELHCGHLGRFPLGTSYTDLVRQVKAFMSTLSGRNVLVVDRSGVGEAVIDMLRESGVNAVVYGVTSTGGQKVNAVTEFDINVPKRNLFAALRRVLDDRRLKIAPSLKEGDVLRSELAQVTVNISHRGHDRYATNRTKSGHFDLTLSLCLATWFCVAGLKV